MVTCQEVRACGQLADIIGETTSFYEDKHDPVVGSGYNDVFAPAALW